MVIQSRQAVHCSTARVTKRTVVEGDHSSPPQLGLVESAEAVVTNLGAPEAAACACHSLVPTHNHASTDSTCRCSHGAPSWSCRAA